MLRRDASVIPSDLFKFGRYEEKAFTLEAYTMFVFFYESWKLLVYL